MSAKKLDSFVSSLTRKSVKTPHQEFAERSHMMRWFGERSDKELKAMKKALLAMQSAKGGAK